MQWEETHLSKPVLGLLGVATMGLFPVAMLPTGPSMWLLGIVFGYLWGFLLIMTGAFFGQTLPYFMGHWLMHDRVQVRGRALGVAFVTAMCCSIGGLPAHYDWGLLWGLS